MPQKANWQKIKQGAESIFSLCLSFNKSYLSRLETITIDKEYLGHEGEIKQYLINLINTHSLVMQFNTKNIRIRSIGRKGQAHKVALETLQEKRAPDKIIGAHDILDLSIK